MDDDSLGLEVVQTYRCAVCAKVLWVTPYRNYGPDHAAANFHFHDV